MLLGVRPALGDELVRDGHRLRIYTPFGRHWYAYSLRRLQENPKIAGYIAADTVGRLAARSQRLVVTRRARFPALPSERREAPFARMGAL